MEQVKQEVKEVKETSAVAAIKDKTIADIVLTRINELSKAGRLDLPQNYSLGNALSSAWLIIQNVKDKNSRPALEVTTKESVANALLNMAILGLNPAKQQGYFIVYGDQLTWFTSYFGNIAAITRLKGFTELPAAAIIYDGDVVELGRDELGEETIVKHETTWDNKQKGIISGAYATVNFGGRKRTAVLTMKEIREAWSMSKTNKDHTIFSGEFAKRTALNRLTKMILKTSVDDDLLAEKIIETEEEHYDFDKDNVVEEVKQGAIEKTGSVETPTIETEESEKIQQNLFKTETQEKPKSTRAF